MTAWMTTRAKRCSSPSAPDARHIKAHDAPAGQPAGAAFCLDGMGQRAGREVVKGLGGEWRFAGCNAKDRYAQEAGFVKMHERPKPAIGRVGRLVLRRSSKQTLAAVAFLTTSSLGSGPRFPAGGRNARTA